MDNNKQNETLMMEISMTRMVLGQQICNSVRNGTYVSLPTVTKWWINQCPMWSRTEWLVASAALAHYLKALNSQGSLEAACLLERPEELFEYHARVFRGIYHRHGKHKNEKTFKRSHDLVREEVVKLADLNKVVSTQNQRCNNGGIWKSNTFAHACKQHAAWY